MSSLFSVRVLLRKELLIQRVDKRKAIALLLLVIPTALIAAHQGGAGLLPASLVLPLAPVLFGQLLTSLFAGNDLQMEEKEKMLEVMKSMGVDFRLMLGCKSAVTAFLPTIAGCIMIVVGGLFTQEPMVLPDVIAFGVCYVLLLFTANIVTALVSVAAVTISTDAAFLNAIRAFSPFVIFALIVAAALFFNAFEHVFSLLSIDVVLLVLTAIMLSVLPSRLEAFLAIRSAWGSSSC